MNKSQSRFIPHSRPVQSRRCVNPGRQAAGRSSGKARRQRNSYWFPIVTMIAALLFAASAILPRSPFDVFAASEDYTVEITSGAGEFSIVVGGGTSRDITLSNDEAVKSVDETAQTVTFNVTLSRKTTFAISSGQPITSLSFSEGAEGFTQILAKSSGLQEMDVSGLTSLSYLNLADTPLGSFANAYALQLSNPSGCAVTVTPPTYTSAQDSVEFEVNGLGNKSDLTVTLNDGTAVALSGSKYSVPTSKLREAYNAEGNEDHQVFFIAQNANKPLVSYYFDVDPSLFASQNQAGDTGNNENNNNNNNENNNNNNNENNNNDDNSPNVKLTIEDKSKTVIADAYIENVESVKPSELKIVAKTLTSANKKTFVAAIKKADKDFNESDPSLIYDIYVVDAKGKKVDLKGKAAVTAVLAYPSKAVKGNREEYDFKIYHQLADKSIDTSIAPTATEDGIMFTTDSFSNFAVSCSAKEQNYLNIPIHKDSKEFAVEAKAHEGAKFANADGTEFTGTGLTLVVKKPADDDRKDFLADIKKLDKDFKDTDKNLLVYEVHLEDSEGNVVTLSQGKVDFMIKYPNDTVKKSYTKYDFEVFHQLADKSVDTKQFAVGGKDGITVTTNSFSLFAVSPKASANPKTADANLAINIAILLAALSLVSFAGVYAKRKGEQY